MTISIRRMSAGSGYRYLLRSVATGDGKRALSTPLTRYYAEVGTPPGRWMGTGLGAFGAGQIRAGMQVTEQQLALLVGMGRDPITGDQLGRAYPEYRRLAARIDDRVAALDPEMAAEDWAAEKARIEAEEIAAGGRHAVAGFDLTFSVPKSVSVLWGVADPGIQERIVTAHHAAVADVLDLFEREVAATRTGFSDRDGAVAQVGVAGVAAVAYDHFDSRAGDPQLHTHVVLANRVKTNLDGRWRSLDGRPVFASRTGLSEHYNALLADRLAQEVGVLWEPRQRGADRHPRWEIVGINDELLSEFSSRTREIEIAKDRLIAEYRATHGRTPSAKTIIELRAQATLATRAPKKIRSLADLTANWRHRASTLLDTDATAWASGLINQPGRPLAAAEVPVSAIGAIAAEVVASVEVKRPTWSHWNLMAEASKQTMDLRFATTGDREKVVAMIVDAAQAKSVRLTPPELAPSPLRLQRKDGTSVFRPRHAAKYTSQLILQAEARLLDRAAATTAPTAGSASGQAWRRDTLLDAQQRLAVESIATSGRLVDLLVGPAGAGKTTAMRSLHTVWTVKHGRGSVIGLAPSAAAAQALADDLGIGCDNTAKWLHECDHGRAELRPGQLVIIDEATLADTITLDRITSIAARSKAKVLLVGDPHQLQSVDAGGAFALLVHRRPDTPELREIHRFTHDWEKEASLALSRGDAEVLSLYARNDRIREGPTDEMLNAAYSAWQEDNRDGLASILVTDSSQAVRVLNERARAERLLHAGATNGHEVQLADDARACVGDNVISRRNDRTLATTHGGWVKNGDRWRITDIRTDGSLVVDRLDPRRHGTTLLPAAYVGEYLDLGYAITAHRSQGITVDTAHVLVSASTTRENLYVSMTRGRKSNVAYVALDQPDDIHSTPEPDDVTARTVLYGVLQHSGATLSAHQTIQVEHELHTGIARLAAELETIAADAQRDRFVDLLRRSGLTDEQRAAVIDSPAFGPFTAALRRAEAHHHDLNSLVPRVVRQHQLDDADDVAAVLRRRIDQHANTTPHGCRLRPRLIAGLIPEPLGPMSAEDRYAIDQRATLIETAANALADEAIQTRPAWIRGLGSPPSAPSAYAEWRSDVATVAAYRSRYALATDLPVGGSAATGAQEAERQRARQAVRRAAARASSNAALAIGTTPVGRTILTP
ncbi:MobF family relaxase [Nocardioides sp. YIM 152315]|uniref:MobF family relaxase n=1 Tax=Nocardioides sp. YIM 152315 TaxID=3031760 RepID=UPI0023DBFADF|nr:MobF family relaxase [Nocardioides sp. YIM 152315]MDF1605871.1 MobF family relaxase [Nocardioides sp. YIM 152315]